MLDKENLMTVLGSRLLEHPRKSVESADTQMIKTSSEHSIISNMIDTIEEGLLKVLSWQAEWMLINPDDVSLKFNRDWFPITIDSSLFTALTNALQQGSISTETYVWNLYQGELLPEGKTVEDEIESVEASRESFETFPFSETVEQ